MPTTKPQMNATSVTPKPVMLYHFSPTTGELIHNALSDTDPLEGLALISAFATAIKPPKIIKGKIAVFDMVKQAWANQSDYRGTVYDTQSQAKELWLKLGALPAGKTNLAPADALHSWDATTAAWILDIAKVQADKLARLAIDYSTASDAGVSYSGTIFQSDSKSIATLSQVLTAISNGWVLPTNFAWLDTANQPQPANAAYLQGLSVAFANHKSALFARLQIAKAAVEAATTQAAINKVVL